MKITAGRTPEHMVVATESVAYNQIIAHWNAVRLYDDYLHNRRRNYVLADGHVEAIGDPIYSVQPRCMVGMRSNGTGELWGYNNHQGSGTPLAPNHITIP
jgi:prepilin-type processing-associated H-X9-DG protein